MSGQPVRFSIITPAYRSEDTVGRTVASVLAQSEDDWELILIDDGSDDDTARVARETANGDARIRVIEGPHIGVSATRNTAIGMSRGDYLVFLDADDELLPDYLKRISKLIDEHPDVALFSCNAWCVDPDGTRQLWHPERAMQRLRSFSLVELIRENKVYISATVRADAVRATGGFRGEMPACEDYSLWLGILRNGGLHLYTPEPLAVYYRSAGSLSADHGREARVLAALMTRLLSDTSLSAKERRAAQLRKTTSEARAELYRRVQDEDTSGGRRAARGLARSYAGRLKRALAFVAAVAMPRTFIRNSVERTSRQLDTLYLRD